MTSSATHTRHNTGLLARAEKRVLLALAHALPRAIHSDHLSAFALVAMIALTGAAWMTITVPAEAPEVVKLERVVVSGVRTPDPTVAQLPRVVIEGRRDAAADATPDAGGPCVNPGL